MNRIKKWLVALGILLILFFGYFYATTLSSECVPPRVKTVPNSLKQEPPLPQTPHYEPRELPSRWQTQPTWQNLFKTGVESDNITTIGIQNNVAWVAANSRILRLDTITGETRSYDQFKNADDPFQPLDILVSQDGTLWTLLYSVHQTYLTLAKYDPQKDTFAIVSDKQNLLQNHPYREVLIFVESQALAETPNGQILMPFQGNILSYDPQANSAEYLLPQSFPQIINDASSSVTALLIYQNKAWFTISEDSDLRSVDLQTGELKNYGHIPTLLDESRWNYYMQYDYRPIAVDGLGRIWMGYFERLTLKQDGQYAWEQISLPPEFVVTIDPDIRYLWASLGSIHTSLNGDLWFESMAGLVRYNAIQDQWCRSTNSISIAKYKVAEDSNGNLWMAINSGKYNGVYKYQLEP